MRRTLSVLAVSLLPVLLAGCEQKPSSPPAAASKAAAPAAAAPAAKASGSARTIGFELVGAQLVGALQFDVSYKGDGRFVGDADGVACETKADGALSSYNHIVDQKLLRAAFASVKGFGGPMRVSECKFEGTPKAEDFTVTVRDSSSPELTELTPPPTIKVVVD